LNITLRQASWISVFASLHGNTWRRRDVSKRGFTYVGTEQADTPAIYDP
jgi:hypothetical protein